MGFIHDIRSNTEHNKLCSLLLIVCVISMHVQHARVCANLWHKNYASINARAFRSEKSQQIHRFKAPRTVTLATTPPIEKELIFVALLPTIEADNKNDCIMPKVLAVLELAIKHVQRNLGFTGAHVDITLISRDTNCSSIYGPIGFFEIYTQHAEVNAVFGLPCDYVLAPVSRYAGIWEVPVLTTGGNAADFSKKSESYPTLTRLKGAQVNNLGNVVRAIIEQFNWSHTALIYQNEDTNMKGNSVCFFCMSAVFNYINKTSVYQQAFEGQTNIKKLLTQLSVKTRVVIMCADPQSIRQIMLTADQLRMIDSGEYVFINIELFSRVPHITSLPWYDKNDTAENNERAKKAYTAMLTVTPKQPNDDEYTRVSNEIKNIAAEKYNYTFHENEPISAFVTSFFDGVLLYAKALNDSIHDDPSVLTRPINGTDMVRRMWNRSFTGITGNVTIDANGDRISAYSLLDMNPETGRFEIVAHFLHNRLEMVPDKEIHWAGDRSEPPPDMPKCGYDGALCPDNSLPGYAILSIVLGILVLVMIICFAFGYRHYKAEAAINSMTWQVSIDDVMFSDASTRFRGSFYSLVRQNSQVSLTSDDIVSLNGDRQIFIPVGVFRGCKVAIKTIDVQNVSLTRTLKLELKRMKDLQHDHLVKFYGACLDPTRSFLLTEYCPKGSLQDILENEQFQLDGMFKLSLMHDIVRGMQFLHSSDIKSHGNLKSSNCVVDSRFVLKISDFGLHSLRKNKWDTDSDVENCQSHAHWSKLLWTAPELLRMEHTRPPEGTQKGDVYSFGIIVHEIRTRQGPFYLGKLHHEKSPQEIIQLVKSYPKLQDHPFRPYIDTSGDNCADINALMMKCWAEDPAERPDFNMLKTTIRKINKDNETGNIVDNLLKRMEQYANNLEELVEERTQDYLEEKKKCEKLLYQLLPQSVAAQLISGQPVVAETFDQVTIYFSDIVGFTALSAESTPMQVVQFLNDLYTCFDSIVENFDVYKVETIGDAYMVVSGLPVRNGNQHAREIARLALALLEAVHNFQIHHRPNDRLKLRIGLHTGACVAGVVGLKMPRYCLFGDTVNTASRMESNGEALKIHISEHTKNALDEFGSFITTKRGYVPMKGKGEMLTYWLEGEIPRAQQTTSPNKLMLSRRSSLKQPHRHANSVRQHLEVPPPGNHISTLQRSNTATPISSYDSAHNHSQRQQRSQQQAPTSKEGTPNLRVKRKISSSSPKLNGNEFKTEDFNYYLELQQAKEQPSKLRAREQSIDRHSLREPTRDAPELANFRLPLASSLKNHSNNSTHVNLKALMPHCNSTSNSSSNLNGVLQPNRTVRLKTSPTISTLVSNSRLEMDNSSLGSGTRIKFLDNDAKTGESGNGMVTKTYTVAEDEELLDNEVHAEHYNVRESAGELASDYLLNEQNCTSKTHLLERAATVNNGKFNINNNSAAQCDKSGVSVSDFGSNGSSSGSYCNILKTNNAKNFKNLFNNSSNSLLCADDCVVGVHLTNSGDGGSHVVGSSVSGNHVLANSTVTQPLLAKINS